MRFETNGQRCVRKNANEEHNFNCFRNGVYFFRYSVNLFRGDKKHTKHYTIGGRTYPVRHYPIAIRLRTRNSTPHQFTKLVGDPVGCAILCIALNPQSGDFSGAILGVRSVALLHLVLLPERNREGTTGRNLKKCTQIDYPTRSKLLEKSKQSKLNTEDSVMNCYRSSFR